MQVSRRRGNVTLESRYDFADTVQHLRSAIESMEATLFVMIDQQAAGANVGLDLRPTTILMFGKPAAGTRLMATHPIAGLDLPLKILVWQDRRSVNIAYAPLCDRAQSYGLPADNALIVAMDRTLADVAAAVAVSRANEAKDSLV